MDYDGVLRPAHQIGLIYCSSRVSGLRVNAKQQRRANTKAVGLQ